MLMRMSVAEEADRQTKADEANPKSRWRRRLVRFGLFSALSLFSLFVGFHVIEYFRGASHWRAAQARADELNESLDLKSLRSAKPPDQENAAATPFFKALFDYGEEFDENDNRLHRNPSLLAEYSAAFLLRRAPGRMPGSESFRSGIDVDLEKLAEYLSREDMSPPFDIAQEVATPPEVVLSALDDFNPLLNELIDAAQRKHSVFPIRYEDHLGAPLPHLGPIKEAAQALRFKASAHLALGDADSAHGDILAALRLAQLLDSDSVNISGLTQLSIYNLALSR